MTIKLTFLPIQIEDLHLLVLERERDQRASQLLQTDQLQPLEVNLWAGWVERKLG